MSQSKGDTMGILDSFSGQGQAAGRSQDMLAAVMSLLSNSQSGGLSGLLQQFSGNGMGDIVNSWVSKGQNLPITPQQISQGLGSDTINQLASKLGLSSDQMSSHLSEMLPSVVDKLTPNGQVEEGDMMSKGMDMLGSLFK
jgi:uncharacterized protein YidB (DUF937 family)